MAKLWITRGLPASGKTQWARKLLDKTEPHGSVIRLNRDDLRRMGLPTDYRVPQHAAENAISVLRDSALAALLTAGRDVICDDTNLRARYVRDLMVIARDAGAAVEVVDFTDVPVEECIRRDALRTGPEYVGETVIRGMHAKSLAQHPGWPLPIPELPQAPVVEPYTPPIPAPGALLMDVFLVDGTVALMGDRNPYDETTVLDDRPNLPVIETVRALMATGWEPVFVSGRTERCRLDTVWWILRNVFRDRSVDPFEGEHAPIQLHMRAVGDQRPDHVVKLELFDQHIRYRYHVRLAIDDRQQVVDLWRSLGIVCMQVAEGKF